MNLFDLTGKVAVVTGSSSGLGASAARALAEAGADVALLARRSEKITANASAICADFGRDAIAVACDVADEESVKAAVQEVLDHFGRIDILFNNAGICELGDVTQIPTEKWDACIATNMRGVMLMSKYVVPGMKERGYGKIVNTASVNAVLMDKEDYLQRPAYNASKAGVVGLTKSMAAGLAKYGITVNAVGPGLFESEMTEALLAMQPWVDGFCAGNPQGRIGKPGELNGTVIYLCSDASSYVQGQFIIVDGGDQLN